MIEIVQASTDKEFDLARSLTRANVDWLKQSFPVDKDKLDIYFSGLEAEMADLPREDAPPTGLLLIGLFERSGRGSLCS